MNLRWMMKKRRTITPPAYPEDAAQAARNLAMDHQTILVNAQSVSNDVLTDKLLPHQAIEDLKTLAHPVPPYKFMWMEFRGPDGGLNGALVVRTTPQWFNDHMHVGDGYLYNPGELQCAVSCFFFLDYQGYVMGPFGEVAYCIGKETGDVYGQVLFRKKKDEPVKGDWFALCLLVIGHALARMNCRNVILKPMNEPKCAPHHQRDLVPATVWHEIKITDTPRIQTTGRGIFGRDESKERRHWVRGHYADYRNGAGLFGNPNLRCVFWIPEHQRGNPALGDVIPEYTLA